MIRFARRTDYFNKDPNTEVDWMDLQHYITYESIKFIHWVYEVNGTVYPFCTAEFKEEFNKARAWNLLKEEQ